MSHESPVNPIDAEFDTWQENLIHWLLVRSNRLQSLPAWMMVGVLACNALAVGLIWSLGADGRTALLIGLGTLAASLADWGLLWALPRTGRSYGPDKPSTLALAILRAMLLMSLGLLTAPVGSGAFAGWGLLLAGGITLVAFYSTWIEPLHLGVTYQHYTTDQWKADSPPLRLLHIGDIHVERITDRERQLNRLVKELKPDVIVFSGDFVNLSYNDDPTAEQAIRQIIGEWTAPLGVYCVPGTPIVEPLERVKAFVKGLDNLRLLLDEWVTLDTPGGPLHILGMVTTHEQPIDQKKIKTLMQHAPKPGMTLLLNHAPDVAPEADTLGVDLYVCGHTHGGQIRLPVIGAVFTASNLGKRFVMGRYDLSRTTLYTSRGVGMEGWGAPRARFLCPPEIILWEITGTA